MKKNIKIEFSLARNSNTIKTKMFNDMFLAKQIIYRILAITISE